MEHNENDLYKSEHHGHTQWQTTEVKKKGCNEASQSLHCNHCPFGSQERSKPFVKVVASSAKPSVADITIGGNEACLISGPSGHSYACLLMFS